MPLRRKLLIFCVLLLVSTSLGCYRENTWTSKKGETYQQEQRYKNFLKVTLAKPGEPLGTTTNHISNVSRETAIAKMSQALNSYDSRKLPYNLSTVFHIATNNKTTTHSEKHNDHEHEHEVPEFALNGVVIKGHYYWVAPLDYVASQETYAAFKQTQGIVPAIAVVDAEDETQPGQLRFEDDFGHPYRITIRYQRQQYWDDTSIMTHLWNLGYRSNMSCKHLDTPVLEPDDHWQLFYATTWNHLDTCNSSQSGGEYYPEKLILVNAVNGVTQSWSLDNPNTPNNERDSSIPKWIDKVYSPWLILRWANRWGFNLNNYMKTSELDNLRADGGMVDEVMGYDNKNIVYVLYMVSFLPDHAVIGVLIVDPQDATAQYWKMDGENAMASKSAAIQTVINAVHLRGMTGEFSVEDMTPHTIFGKLSWESELSQPFKDSSGDTVGSHYSGTVLLEANNDLQPAHVIIEQKKHAAFTKYEEFVYLKPMNRIGSNALDELKTEGSVSRITIVVDNGSTSYLINLVGQEGLWEVKLGYIGDPLVEDVLDIKVGDRVSLRYADIMNRKTHLVREIRDLSHPGTVLHPDIMLNLPSNAVPTISR